MAKKERSDNSAANSLPGSQADLENDTSSSAEPVNQRFPIVGIGASAGGLEALVAFFQNLEADCGAAFVVVTHQHADQTSMLPELLAKESALPVLSARDGAKLEPNHVYVSMPGSRLALFSGTLHQMEKEQSAETDVSIAKLLPIDYFFRSLAEDQQEMAVSIVLSGTGTDGSAGLKAIKAESGMVMVQTPESSKFSGMPSSAIATHMADFVLPAAEMPKQLVAYLRHSDRRKNRSIADPDRALTDSLQKIFLLLRSRTGQDFSSYKESTIRRRIERRMNVHQIHSAKDYVRFLQGHAFEIDALFKELLISVTAFFRDPEAFESLSSQALQASFMNRLDDSPFRVWVPGCASGEEVYSLAILIHECMQETKRHVDVQIFGTDLDADAIDVARQGRYTESIAANVSPQRLERYFTREDHFFRLRNEIREMVIFAPQNVIKDPPFTKLDLVSCRNMLIYLNTDLQKKLIPVFHYALKRNGTLFLGPSESIGPHNDLFDLVDKKWKIFRRRDNAALGDFSGYVAAAALPLRSSEMTRSSGIQINTEPHASKMLERWLMDRFCLASVVVNSRGDIVHVQGHTGEYLELAQGQARTNVAEMARDGLGHEISSALRLAVTGEQPVVRENLRVKTSGGYSQIDLLAEKILEPEPIRGLFVLSFRPSKKMPEPGATGNNLSDDSGQHATRTRELEEELLYMKQSYQTTLEELETSTEELKSTNEELQSTNEEIQSTNEELETSKEEMQSMNEELTTVNAELQSKVEILLQTNDDMQNLLNSTNIATVFLDNDLKIKRYTQRATDVIAIRSTDVGRPILELTSNLSYNQLSEDCEEVLRTLIPKRLEVNSKDDTWYDIRILPYRTSDNVIEGIVLTFIAIDQLKAAQASGAARDYFESIFDTLREPLVVLDESYKINSCNRSFYQTFHTNPAQTEGVSIYNLESIQWDVAELKYLLEDLLPNHKEFEHFRVSVDAPRMGTRRFVINARILKRVLGQPEMILLAMEKDDDQ